MEMTTQLQRTMKSVFTSNEGDVEILLQDDSTIKVISYIVKRACPVFEAMLSSSFAEGKEKKIKMTEYKPENIKKLLTFVYCGETNVSEDFNDLFELLSLTSQYQQDIYVKFLEKHLCEKINEKNVIEIISICGEYPQISENIMKKCAEFIGKILLDGSVCYDRKNSDSPRWCCLHAHKKACNYYEAYLIPQVMFTRDITREKIYGCICSNLLKLSDEDTGLTYSKENMPITPTWAYVDRCCLHGKPKKSVFPYEDIQKLPEQIKDFIIKETFFSVSEKIE